MIGRNQLFSGWKPYLVPLAFPFIRLRFPTRVCWPRAALTPCACKSIRTFYAAYLRLEANNRYEYDWFSNPNKKILEAQLNVLAKKGFSLVNSYAQTYCSGGSEEDQANPTSPESLLFRMNKGDGFLFERENASTEPVKEYKVFMAKVHLGDSAEKNLQAAIDEVRQPGFHPAKVLFAPLVLRLSLSINIRIIRYTVVYPLMFHII